MHVIILVPVFFGQETCDYPELGYDCMGNLIAEVGDDFQGGVLFYIDSTGNHGLIASKYDVSAEPIKWGCEWNYLTNVDYSSIGYGYAKHSGYCEVLLS